MTLDYVSLDDCVVNGLLEIHGLTKELPHLTTFFEGEIIGDNGAKAGFLTNRWGATESDDLKHWSRFAPFRGLKSQLVKPHLNYCNNNKPFIFMRWKETCVIPPREVQVRLGCLPLCTGMRHSRLGHRIFTEHPTLGCTPALPPRS